MPQHYRAIYGIYAFVWIVPQYSGSYRDDGKTERTSEGLGLMDLTFVTEDAKVEKIEEDTETCIM